MIVGVKRFILCVVFVNSITIAYSQSFNFFFEDTVKSEHKSKLSLKIDNLNFLKNNEYFNSFVQGYTLIGYWLKPQVIYNISPRLSFNVGFHAQKYSGVKGFSEFKPLLSLIYKTGKNAKLVFGTLSPTLNHNMGDYLVAEELVLTDNIESGLQFIYKTNRIYSDTWLDWKQFIFKNSPYPEIIFFGSSNIFSLIKNKNSEFNLFLGGTVSHVGGQIDASEVRVETIMNSKTGLSYKYIIKSKLINSVKIFGDYYTALNQGVIN